MIPTLTIEQEYELVVDDIFGADETAADICINHLCEETGLANCSENAEQIMLEVIDGEDRLAEIYSEYEVMRSSL